VDRFSVSDSTNLIVSGQGSLPITIQPARTNGFVHVEYGIRSRFEP
jgi:hypothetical protein